jgi:hypothetical protein
MPTRTRYRREAGFTCIDLHVRSTRQLFDTRDPAPFRERDLAPDALEYLLEAADEIPRDEALHLVIAITEPAEPELTPEVIGTAIRAHFEYERHRRGLALTRHLRRSYLAFAVGLATLAALLTLAEFTTLLPDGRLREVVREGVVITGWVAMWRPLELLLYDWWPILHDRRRFDRLLSAKLSVEPAPGAGPTSGASSPASARAS